MKKSYYFLFVLLFSTSPLLAQVDYDTEIQPIFNSRCTSCHGSNGGLSVESFNALMASVGNNYGDKLVVPFNADESGLVDKIEPNPTSGNQMPQGQTALTADQINLIRQWINEGANAVPSSNEGEAIIPESFKLHGNYPNPFNPSTQIQFDVPVATQYQVSVYSIQGQLVSEQVGNVSAGRVNVAINLGANPSGLYFYKVVAQNNGVNQLIGTGRMSLIK